MADDLGQSFMKAIMIMFAIKNGKPDGPAKCAKYFPRPVFAKPRNRLVVDETYRSPGRPAPTRTS